MTDAAKTPSAPPAEGSSPEAPVAPTTPEPKDDPVAQATEAEGNRQTAAVKPGDCRTLYAEVRQWIVDGSGLEPEACAMISFWVMATWFPEACSILPCLVLFGDGHDARNLLLVLKDVCYKPLLLAGFRKTDLRLLADVAQTILIAEPRLALQKATLLGSLTHNGFATIDGRVAFAGAGFRAVYIGNDAPSAEIRNAMCDSVFIHATLPLYASIPSLIEDKGELLEALRGRLQVYREVHLGSVESQPYRPRAGSSQTAAMARTFGSCLVEAPDLQQQVTDLLCSREAQMLADRTDSEEGCVVQAVLKLIHEKTEPFYVKDVAKAATSILSARGETVKLNPWRCGHILRKVNLPSRSLGSAGNGFRLDTQTRVHIHDVAELYCRHALEICADNLSCSLCAEKRDGWTLR